MPRLRWRTVAAFSTAFAAGGLAVFGVSIERARRQAPIAAPSYPEQAPFDLADARTRAAFDEYTRFSRKDEASLAFECGWKSGETYRVEVLSAMDTHFDIALVDVNVAGGRAFLDVKAFVREGTDRWRSVRQNPVSAHEIEVIRDRAALLLASHVPAVGERPLDSSEWTVQMCRRGRYHFFQRYDPKRDAPEDAPFVAFTDAVMALRNGDRAP